MSYEIISQRTMEPDEVERVDSMTEAVIGMKTTLDNQILQIAPVGDLTLVDHILKGDRSAFTELHDRYAGRLFRLVNRIIRSVHDVDDVTQEAFLQIHLGLERFEGRSSLSTWIYRIASNVALQQLRSTRRAPLAISLDGIPGNVILQALTPARPGPEEESEHRELLGNIVTSINSMVPVHREILVLGAIQGHSHAWIADCLHLKPGIIKTRLHRARQALRRSVEH